MSCARASRCWLRTSRSSRWPPKALIELIGAPSSEWLGVPLKRGERTFGVLVIQSYQEDFHYSERDRELLIFVSQHIADALWRKQAERELKESQRFLAAVFNGIQDGISVLDRDLNILQVNQAMDKMVCSHQLPLAGKKCFQAYYGSQEPCRVCPTIRALRERTPPGGHRAAGRQRRPARLAGAARLSAFRSRTAS